MRLRAIVRPGLLAVVLASLVVVGACGGGTSSASPSVAGAASGGPATNLTITAKDIAYSPASMSAPAGSPLHVRFDNQDVGVPHDLALFGDAAFSTKIFASEIKTGPAVEELSIPGLVPGTYQFRCNVHPNMTAELKVGA